MSEEPGEHELENQALDKALDIVGEHFDAVQICAVRKNPSGNSTWVSRGVGCHFQRRGVVRTWILREDEGDRVDARNER